MSTGAAIRDRSPAAAHAAQSAKPVMLLTLNVPLDTRATQVAIDAAGETGAELYLCDAIPLAYADCVQQMARSYGDHRNRNELDAVGLEARERGIKTTQMFFHNPKPISAAAAFCREEGVGLLVLGSERARLSRWTYHRAVRTLRRDAGYLLWLPD